MIPFNTTRAGHAQNGFALVVTLSLMILLTIIAVGLLTLASISLRSSSQGKAAAEARANARLALVMASGELQKEMGPDSRISAPHDAGTTASGGQPDTSRPSARVTTPTLGRCQPAIHHRAAWWRLPSWLLPLAEATPSLTGSPPSARRHHHGYGNPHQQTLRPREGYPALNRPPNLLTPLL